MYPLKDNDLFWIVKPFPTLLTNDFDDNVGEWLTVKKHTDPQHGTLENLGADGSFIYDPNDDFIGTDTFTYQVYDETGLSAIASVEIEVKAPDTQDDFYSSVNSTIDTGNDLWEDGTWANDSFSPIGASNVITQAPAHGTLIPYTGVNSGFFKYTDNLPANGAAHKDSFKYKIVFSLIGIETPEATVNLVTYYKKPMNIVWEEWQNPFGPPEEIEIPGKYYLDTKEGQSQSFEAQTQTGLPINHTVQTAPLNGTLVEERGGNLVYKPKEGFSGTDQFTLKMENNGQTRAIDVMVNVKPIGKNLSLK